MHPEAAALHVVPACGAAVGQPGGCDPVSTTDPEHPSGIIPTAAIIAAAQVFHVVFIAILPSSAAPNPFGAAVEQDHGKKKAASFYRKIKPRCISLPAPRAVVGAEWRTGAGAGATIACRAAPRAGKLAAVIQIFGTIKCKTTRAAQRFFADRSVKVQSVDLREKGLSKGELVSVARAVGGYAALYDHESPRVKERGLQRSNPSEARLAELLLEDPSLLRTPIVRDGTRAAVGAAEPTWKAFAEAAKK